MSLSRKKDEKYFSEDEDKDAEEDVKSPPQQVPSSNLDGEWASHKPVTSHKHHHHDRHEHEKPSSVVSSKDHMRHRHVGQYDVPSSNSNEERASHKPATSHNHHHHHTHEYQDDEAVAMEEGVPFEENKNTIMSKRVDEGLDEIMSPPQRASSSNLTKEWASQKDEEDVTMEEGVPFKEKEENIEGTSIMQKLVAEEGISGHHMVSPSRRPDVDPGAEELDTEFHHPPVERRHHIPNRVLPGAYREGGLDNEEKFDEDELTIQSTTEPPIPPTFSAELVNTAEEERRVQDKINQALQEALEKEHQKAVVAEVISDRYRRWKFAGAFLLLILIVVGVVLGFMLPDSETVISQDLINLLSSHSFDGGEALRNESTPQYEALKWLAVDVILANYTGQQKIQRYALATLYYSTKGDENWTRNDKWLSEADVCENWYQYQDTTINCTSVGEVTRLSLYNNNLIGMMPAEIGMLTSLTALNLSFNLLSGTIPTSIGMLTNLNLLDLGSNNLYGKIPTELGLLTNLEYLFFSENEFTGAIPTEIGLLTNFQPRLDAFRSVLISVSEQGFADPNSPQHRALYWIVYEDPAQTTVGATPHETIKQRYVAAVLYFALGGDEWTNKYKFLSGGDICLWNENQTSGIICDSTNVRVVMLNISKNGLSGTIPEEIGYLSDLSTIQMTDGWITGTLPSSLEDLSLLAELDLTSCQLGGTIPDFLYTHALLTKLALDDNSFTGTIPPSLGTSPLLWAFWVMNSQLKGSIPASVGQSLVLESVDLSGNSLTGAIPEFSPSSQIRWVSLANNTLYGSIPSSIGNLQNLQSIYLDNTQLEGTIPTELGQCQNLEYISFDFNQLKGDIGPVIDTLPTSLTSLALGENRFSGTVPTSIGTFINLDFLDLADNILNGTIPSELGLLTNLEVLNLHSNGFNGTVPTSLASLILLKYLFLNDNDLTGSLDATFCVIDFEVFAANNCGQDDVINCSCCTHCCDPPPSTFCYYEL